LISINSQVIVCPLISPYGRPKGYQGWGIKFDKKLTYRAEILHVSGLGDCGPTLCLKVWTARNSAKKF